MMDDNLDMQEGVSADSDLQLEVIEELEKDLLNNIISNQDLEKTLESAKMD